MPRPSVREKLIEVGLETLHSAGFNGCSVEDITDAAGVPKGSFFNHFKSKEGFALEALSRYGQRSRLEILFDKSKPALERLRDHFEYLVGEYAKHQFERGCLLGNFGAEMANSHPQVRAALEQMFAYWCDAVTSVLRDAQSEGSVDPRRDAHQLADFLVNAFEGVVMRLKIVRNPQPAEEFFTVCFQLLLK
jgi:TetR/AcrR family transcriptional repressor of nem operon